MTERRSALLQAGMLTWTICSVFLTGGCGRSSPVEGKVAWSDSTGDVQGLANLPDRPTPDLQEVVVGSANGELVAELNMKDLRKRLDYVSADGKRYGASLADLLLDTDLDPNTGGAPLSLWRMDTKPARFGYEFRIAVLAGFRIQSADGSGSKVGDISLDNANYVKIEPIIKFQVYSLGSQRFGSKHIELSEADSERLDSELALLENEHV